MAEGVPSFIPSYIEVLAGLLVLGITLPTILIQIPARNRAIRDKHARKKRFLGRQYSLGTVFKPVYVGILAVFSIMFLAGYLVPPHSFLCNQQGLGPWCPFRDFFVDHVAGIAFIILGIDVIVTAIFIHVLGSYTKERILLSLANKCRDEVSIDNGRINKTVLQSIGELGQFCDVGSDKESVLDTLAGLAYLELAFDSWVDLARTVRETVVSGSEQNYIHALTILQDMVRAASDQATNNSSDKEIHLADMLLELENVMIQAFTLRNPRVTATILTGYDELALQAPNAHAHPFFRIGRAALGLYEMGQAVAILAKFHTKVVELLDSPDHDPTNVPEAVHVFFGLLAHFWHYGKSARRHALRYIEALADMPSWDAGRVDAQVQAAKEFFENNGFIETADHLEQMLYEGNQRRIAQEFLSRIGQLDEDQCQRVLSYYLSMEMLRKADVEGITACGVPKPIAHIILRQVKIRQWIGL